MGSEICIRDRSEHDLLPIFKRVIKDAGNAEIVDRDYLMMFGLLKQEQMTAKELWQYLFVEVYNDLSDGCRTHIAHVLEHGCLAARILSETGTHPTREELVQVYSRIAHCLDTDTAFV